MEFMNSGAVTLTNEFLKKLTKEAPLPTFTCIFIRLMLYIVFF